VTDQSDVGDVSFLGGTGPTCAKPSMQQSVPKS